MKPLLSKYSSDRFSELPIFVVNFERSPVRRQSMQIQLEAIGMAYEIVPAIDGLSLSESQLAKYSETQAMQALGRPLVKTQIGCA
jgi:GR25 family glycosyltransferase involved in LPS biosynthesis